MAKKLSKSLLRHLILECQRTGGNPDVVCVGTYDMAQQARAALAELGLEGSMNVMLDAALSERALIVTSARDLQAY